VVIGHDQPNQNEKESSMKFKVVAAVGLSALALAGCGVDPPQENDSRFADIKVNGTRCIVFTPGDGALGTTMQCDFAGYVPAEQVPAPGPIDSPELSPPPPEEIPVEPTP
jgi:hypothetical protein